MMAFKTLTHNLKANLKWLSYFEQIYSGAEDSSIGFYYLLLLDMFDAINLYAQYKKSLTYRSPDFRNFCSIKELINETTTVCSYW